MTPEESGSGYPEEQPSEVAGDGDETPQRESGGEAGSKHSQGSGNEDEGTATGNPNNAGADEGD
jgi:hypothetical protein